MVKRVKLDVNGLTISKPGFDVDSATDAQLSLSSTWQISNCIVVGAYNTRNKTVGTIETVFDGTSLGYTPHAEFFITFDLFNNSEVFVNLTAFWRIFFYWEGGLLKVRYGETQQNTQDVYAIYYLYSRPVL